MDLIGQLRMPPRVVLDLGPFTVAKQLDEFVRQIVQLNIIHGRRRELATRSDA